MGLLQKCITTDGLVMGAFIDSTDIVLEAGRLHGCTPVAISALGRLLTGVSLMGNKLKEKEASITVRVNGGGELGSVIAVSDYLGNVRGYAQTPGLLFPPDSSGRLDVSGAIGTNGQLTVIKDYGTGQPYCAQCPLISGEIAEDISGYYANSEQIPTILALSVHFDKLWRVDKAGGLLIQLLPAADEREIVKLEAALQKLPPLSTMMTGGDDPSKALSPSEILQLALSGFDVEFFDPETVSYRCDCSLERVKKALITLDKAELLKMANEDGNARVECHFCDKVYVLSKEELIELAETAK